MEFKTVEELKAGQTFISEGGEQHMKTTELSKRGNLVCPNLNNGTISYFAPEAEVEAIRVDESREISCTYGNHIGIQIGDRVVISDLEIKEAQKLIQCLVSAIITAEHYRKE